MYKNNIFDSLALTSMDKLEDDEKLSRKKNIIKFKYFCMW